LIYKHFAHFVELCYKYNIKMNLTTNGTFPRTTEKTVTEWAKLIVPITTDVKISWNGATAKTSQEVMSGIDFEQTVENVKEFIRIRDEHFAKTGYYCRAIYTNETVFFQCKKLVLAAGCLSTARIVLRSLNAYDTSLPVISNHYSYLPALQPYLLGKDTDERKIGFAQLSLFYDPNADNMDVAMGSIYSYRSLMAFHLLKETPMGVKDAYRFLEYMMPAFTIMGLFHPERSSNTKHLSLHKNAQEATGDYLKVHYELSAAEVEKVSSNERKFSDALRTLNCFVLKKINPGNGSGIHYAGTLPFSTTNELFTTHPNGLLAGTKNIFIADGSGIKYLPGKGLTLSLMANAHLVAHEALKNH
ncbi:hypothetical protein MEO93_29745, partial [Dolichospermum sp. ST_sed3]|nr:hypothetical protein [Dolichospermum sp. ST_sed3]